MLRTGLLAFATLTWFAACQSTSNGAAAPSETRSTVAAQPQSAESARRIAETLATEQQWLYIELSRATGKLAAGDNNAAGLGAAGLIQSINRNTAPLNDDMRAILGRCRDVAESAGFTDAALQAEARLRHAVENPGKYYTSFVQPNIDMLRPGKRAAVPPPKSPALRDALDQLPTPEPVAGGAGPTDAGPGITGTISDASSPASPDPTEPKIVEPVEDLSELLRQARAAIERGDFDAATGFLERLLAEVKRLSKPSSTLVRDAQVLLAEIEYRRGHLERAEELLRAAIAGMEHDGGATEPAVEHAIQRLRDLLAAEGRFAESKEVGAGAGPAGEPKRDSSSGSADGDPFAAVGADAIAELELGPAQAAWSAGGRTSSMELAEARLRAAESQGSDAMRVRQLRLLLAEMALELGHLDRARAFVLSVLDGDAIASRAEGEQRKTALALLERIELRREQRRQAEEDLFRAEPTVWWKTTAGVPPHRWPSSPTTDLDEALDARESQGAGGDGRSAATEEPEPFDIAAARAKARQYMDSRELERALELLQQIVFAYDRSPNFDAPDRIEAMHDLAALYRVMGNLDAARILETRLR